MAEITRSDLDDLKIDKEQAKIITKGELQSRQVTRNGITSELATPVSRSVSGTWSSTSRSLDGTWSASSRSLDGTWSSVTRS